MDLMSIAAVLVGTVASVLAVLQSRRNRDWRLFLLAGLVIAVTMTPVMMLVGGDPVGDQVPANRVGQFVSPLSLIANILALVLVGATTRGQGSRGVLPIGTSPTQAHERPTQSHERLRRRNEELLEATNRLASVGGWELDLQTMELLWTAQTCRIHGVPTDYRPDLESAIGYYAPEGRTVIEAAVQESMKNGTSWDLELPLVTAQGRRRWVRAQGACDSVDGKPVRLHGAFQDVTERKEAEDELKRRLEFEATLARISSAFINLPAPEIVQEIDSCLGLVGRFLRVDRVIVEEFSEDRLTLVPTHHWSSPGLDSRPLATNAIKRSRPEWGEVIWSRGEMVVAPKISDLPAEAVAERERMKELGAQAYLGAPLVINGKIAGAISFCSAHTQQGWPSDLVHQVKLVGEVLANALTRKRNEEALRASEKKYRRLYEKTPAMLHSLDPHGKILTVSDHWLESMGYERAEVIGRPIFDFLTEESRRSAKDVCIPKFRKSDVLIDEELQAVKKDGTVIETLLSAIAERDGDGRFVGTLVVVIDVTERKRAQEESRKHRDVLTHMTRLSTMGELVAGIAHEVKQPLYAITNFASAAALSLSNFDPSHPPASGSLDELKEWNQAVKRAAKRASEIIDRLREFSRKDESRREQIRLSDVIHDSIGLVAFEARQCQVSVETQFDDQASTIHADRIQCEQVVVNLLHNAYEALMECDYPRRVVVRTTVVDHCIEVQVVDNGPGIVADQQGKLFEAFHTTKAAGMGMGLAISQTIVEDHGGRLWGSSNEWGGATFHVTLPCREKTSVPC
jgi:two-component system sensor kinase FixL